MTSKSCQVEIRPIHLSNLKTVFTYVIGGMAASSKTVGPLFFLFSKVSLRSTLTRTFYQTTQQAHLNSRLISRTGHTGLKVGVIWVVSRHLWIVSFWVPIPSLTYSRDFIWPLGRFYTSWCNYWVIFFGKKTSIRPCTAPPLNGGGSI